MYQGIRVHKKGFQARANILRDENGDVVADPKSILNRWTKYFSQLLNVHEGQDIEDVEVQMRKSYSQNCTDGRWKGIQNSFRKIRGDAPSW